MRFKLLENRQQWEILEVGRNYKTIHMYVSNYLYNNKQESILGFFLYLTYVNQTI